MTMRKKLIVLRLSLILAALVAVLQSCKWA